MLLQQAPSVGTMEEGEREAERGEIRCLLPDALHTSAWEKGLSNPHAVPSEFLFAVPGEVEGHQKSLCPPHCLQSKAGGPRMGSASPCAHSVERKRACLGLLALLPTPELWGLC